MFLATASPWSGTAPTFLLTGDRAIALYDRQTIAALGRVGVPTVTLSPDALLTLAKNFDPTLEQPLMMPPPTTLHLIEGGNPATVFFRDVFNGGDAESVTFGDPGVEGGTAADGSLADGTNTGGGTGGGGTGGGTGGGSTGGGTGGDTGGSTGSTGGTTTTSTGFGESFGSGFGGGTTTTTTTTSGFGTSFGASYGS